MAWAAASAPAVSATGFMIQGHIVQNMGDPRNLRIRNVHGAGQLPTATCLEPPSHPPPGARPRWPTAYGHGRHRPGKLAPSATKSAQLANAKGGNA